jgi:hypothetical protein
MQAAGIVPDMVLAVVVKPKRIENKITVSTRMVNGKT